MRFRYACAIAHTTLRESIRSKILYAVLCFAALLIVAATLFGSVSIGELDVVVKDFGLFSISLMSIAFVIISGTSLLHKELYRKTIYNLLSKSVTRGEFIAGKFLGLMGTASVIVGLMCLGLVGFVALLEGRIDWPIVWAHFYILCELAVLCSVVLFFSTIVITPFLSGMFTFGLFLAGRSTGYLLKLFPDSGESSPASYLAHGLYWILPHLDELYVANLAAYGEILPLSHAVWALLYVSGYSLVTLLIAWYAFSKRDFNQ